MAPTIQDVNVASHAADRADGVELITEQEVVEAARAVVRAAVAARRREFIAEVQNTGPDEQGIYRENYLDTATGDLYTPLSGGRYRNNMTGQVVDGNPTDVDPNDYQWIIEAFVYFHERWPSYPRTLAEHCTTAKSAIQSGQMSPIVGVAATVSNNWSGEARDDFYDFFLAQFVMHAVTNQQLLLDELAVAMYAYEAVLRQGRLAARDIANQTVDVLDSVEAYGPGVIGRDVVLGVVGVMVAVVAAVATGGTAFGVTLGLIGAGVSVAQIAEGLQGGEDDKHTITGHTVDQILQSLRTALDKLRAEMDNSEAALAKGITNSAERVRTWLASTSPLEVGTILPNEPNDAVPNVTSGQAPPGDLFRPRT